MCVVVGQGLAVTVSGLGVIACTYGLARYAYGLFLPVFREQFALSGALSGAIATGGYASYCGAAVAAHRLLGRGHARGAAGLAGVLAALSCTAIAVAPSAGVLAAGVFVAGTGAGLASPAMVASSRRPCRRRGARGRKPSSTPAPAPASSFRVPWRYCSPTSGASPGCASPYSRSWRPLECGPRRGGTTR